jgi:deoxycytidine triphosphate deaminase
VAHETTSRSETNAALWSDPDVGSRVGVLLSDRIGFYSRTLGLIEPFREDRLGPASYDISLGNECWYADHAEDTGEPKRVLAPDENLILEPNSIVYVTSSETLNLPFYLVGRFNLKLRLLHAGLLVGTGPQIDPGFSGRLSCPLHNLSNSRVSLKCGVPFAVLEFQKTTPFAEAESWTEGTSLDEVRKRGEARSLKGLQGQPCLTFPSKSLHREPVKRYIPGYLVTSSLQGLQRKLRDLEGSVNDKIATFAANLRAINIGAMIAVAAVSIPMATYFVTLYNSYRSANENVIQAIERAKSAEVERGRLEKMVTDLEARLRVAEEAIATATIVPRPLEPRR